MNLGIQVWLIVGTRPFAGGRAEHDTRCTHAVAVFVRDTISGHSRDSRLFSTGPGTRERENEA